MKIYKSLFVISITLMMISIIIIATMQSQILINIGISFLAASFISAVDNIARYYERKNAILDAFFREIIHFRHNYQHAILIDNEDIFQPDKLPKKVNKLLSCDLHSAEYMSDLWYSSSFFIKNKERTNMMWDIYNWCNFHYDNMNNLLLSLQRVSEHIDINERIDVVEGCTIDFIKKYQNELNNYAVNSISELLKIKDAEFCKMMNCISGKYRYALSSTKEKQC